MLQTKSWCVSLNVIINIQISKMDYWFKHILFITRHDKRIGQSKKLCFALSMDYCCICAYMHGHFNFWFSSNFHKVEGLTPQARPDRSWTYDLCIINSTLNFHVPNTLVLTTEPSPGIFPFLFALDTWIQHASEKRSCLGCLEQDHVECCETYNDRTYCTDFDNTTMCHVFL